MGGDDKIIVLDDEVMNGNDRKVRSEPVPRIAIVERDVYARLGSHEEKSRSLWILSNHASDLAVGDSLAEGVPVCPVVDGAVEIGGRVVELVTGGRDICLGGVVE